MGKGGKSIKPGVKKVEKENYYQKIFFTTFFIQNFYRQMSLYR